MASESYSTIQTNLTMNTITSEAFEQRVQLLLSEWHVPALSIAVFDNATVVAKGFGLASLEENTKATEDTIYDWASSSKSLTAAAIGKLIDDGHFAWTAPVAELLPDDFVLPDNAPTDPLSVEDILSHRSGIATHDLSYYGIKAEHPDTPRSITRNLRNLQWSTALRAKFQYSNIMYTVSSYLVEQISQKPFDHFLQTNVFDLLGMQSSYLQPSSVIKAGQGHRYATPYIWQHDTQKYNVVPRRDQPEGQGAGLIQSTVVDYAKWVQSVMNKNDTLFSAETYQNLVKPRIIIDPEAEEEDLLPFTSHQSYALGWEIMFYRGHRLIRHDGAEVGYRSRMVFVPHKQFGLVIVGNAKGAEHINDIISMELINQALDVPSADRIDWAHRARKDVEKAQNDTESSLVDLRAKLSQNSLSLTAGPPPSLALSSYTGSYSNTGYHTLVVSIKDHQLFIDATDRGMPFNVVFEHVRDNRIFIADVHDDEDGSSYVRAEFELDMNNVVCKMGLALEEDLDPALIWFDKKV